MKLLRTLRWSLWQSLRSRSFAVFATGNLVSQTGEWMTWVALNWAVLEFTGSALFLGIINACRLLPVFVLSVPAGVLADRTDRRKVLIPLQTATLFATLAVGFLLSAGSPFWLLTVVVTLRSVFMAVVTPVRNALIPNLVPEDRVASAVATDGTVRNLARIAGPAIAGLLLAVTEVEIVFLISALSILGVLFSLIVIKPRPHPETPDSTVGADIREAAAFVRNDASVQSLLILAVAPLVFAFPYTAMMPLFTGELLNIGPEGLGVLLSVAAGGALAGSLLLSFGTFGTSGDGVGGAGRWLVFSTIGLGVALISFVLSGDSGSFVVAATIIFLVGFTSSTYRTLSRITLQTHVPDRLRGRILSVALMDRGLMPLGAILIGVVAEIWGATAAGVFMGGGCVVVTLAVVAIRRRVWNL